MDYSIVICTYNPDERILKRCLDAVYRLDARDVSTEVILVDNNSAVAVSSLPVVREYAAKIPAMKMINVAEQGVKYARMAAIEQATGKYIVYFDYDNEPEYDYLQALRQLHVKYPQVAAWGPGHVWVDFIDGIDDRIENFARLAFQERHEQADAYACIREWQGCYPFGTGLCTYAPLLKEYTALARKGMFTLSGRKGNQLSSGEDTQMVLLCISRGYAAGVSPALKIRHIIPAARAGSKYVQRLLYGTSLCYETCLVQVFPEYRAVLERKLLKASTFSRKAWKKYLRARWSSDPHRMFDLAGYIGSNAGVYRALDKPVPPSVNRIVKYLKVE